MDGEEEKVGVDSEEVKVGGWTVKRRKWGLVLFDMCTEFNVTFL